MVQYLEGIRRLGSLFSLYIHFFLIRFALMYMFLSVEDCPVDTTPPLAIVEYGASFRANCSQSSSQVTGMGWESSLGGVSLQEGASSVLLNIPAVTQWTFMPGCFVNLVGGNQCERLVDITVYSK